MKLRMIVSLCLALSAVACNRSPSTAVGSTSLGAGIDHPYFPLRPGTMWIYEGDHLGQPRREEVVIPEETRTITGVECTALMQLIFDGDELSELTTEYYAQDSQGNVWKYGEQSFEFAGGQLVVSLDSWEAGLEGAEPWVEFSNDPQGGDVHLGYRPTGWDEYFVVSTNETAEVPAGRFENCLQVLENPGDPADKDIILYARGVGKVSERSTGGKITLVEVRKKK